MAWSHTDSFGIRSTENMVSEIHLHSCNRTYSQLLLCILGQPFLKLYGSSNFNYSFHQNKMGLCNIRNKLCFKISAACKLTITGDG